MLPKLPSLEDVRLSVSALPFLLKCPYCGSFVKQGSRNIRQTGLSFVCTLQGGLGAILCLFQCGCVPLAHLLPSLHSGLQVIQAN